MKIHAENRQARFDYTIVTEYEAGIELLGHEVKAVKSGKLNLSGGHITVRGAEAYLVNVEIQPYQEKNTPEDYDRKRLRKLILSKAEIAELGKAEGTKGLTIMPLLVYNIGRFIKVRIAVVKGKKTHDKRESLKKRTVDREIAREYSDR